MTRYFLAIEDDEGAWLEGPFMPRRFAERLRFHRKFHRVLYAVSCRPKP